MLVEAQSRNPALGAKFPDVVVPDLFDADPLSFRGLAETCVQPPRGLVDEVRLDKLLIVHAAGVKRRDQQERRDKFLHRGGFRGRKRFVHWTRATFFAKGERMAKRDIAGRRQTFAAAIVIAILLLGGWWLMSELQRHRDIGNCIDSGRRDCVPVTPDK